MLVYFWAFLFFQSGALAVNNENSIEESYPTSNKSTILINDNSQKTVYANSISGNDSNDGLTPESAKKTFHSAYLAAESNDTIDLTGTFTWTDAGESGDVQWLGYMIEKSLTIRGQSAQNTIVQAHESPNSSDRRVFGITAFDVVFENLTIRHGTAAAFTSGAQRDSQGGAIGYPRLNYSSTDYSLTVRNCVLTANRANPNSFGTNHVVIFSTGNFLMENSTVHSNTSTKTETYFVFLNVQTSLSISRIIRNSTFSNNTTSDANKTTTADVFLDRSRLTIEHCTFFNSNSSIRSHVGNISIVNTIAYGNTDTKDLFFPSNGTTINIRNSIVQSLDATTNTPTIINSEIGDQPNLNLSPTLQLNESKLGTPTFAVLENSIAIDAADSDFSNSPNDTDQRGLLPNGIRDIGAFEFEGLVTPPYAGGSGTEFDPYQISDWTHLHNIREDLEAYFILNNNLDETSSGYETYASSTANNNKGWLPIGDNLTRFSGKFDGKNHTIKGLTINRGSTANIGLFSVAELYADFKNVGLIDVSIIGGSNVGGLIGSIGSKFSKISNVFVTGNVTGVSGVGGLLGRGSSLNISNSYTDVAVEATHASLPRAGGFIGYTSARTNFSYCYSVGSVSSLTTATTGGFIGSNSNFDNSSLEIYWDIETSGQTSSIDGIGKTTAEMKALATFTGWNFTPDTGIWNIKQADSDEGFSSYPYLQGFSYDIPEAEPVVNPIPGLELLLYAGGSGTPEDPFQISNWKHLNNVRENLSAHFILKNNLDEASTDYETYASATANDNAGWLPIGGSVRFSGNFDGKNYTIKGLTVNRSSTDDIGLFGIITGALGSNIVLKNVGLIDVSIIGNRRVGGLIGRSISYVEISGVYVTGTVKGVSEIGGLIGRTEIINISNSYTDVAVEASNTTTPNIGGFVGFTRSNSVISNSYSKGFVKSTTTNTTGGFTGSGTATVSDSYWDTETSGQTNSIDGIGKTSAEMKTQSTFSSWDFTSEGFWNMQQPENGFKSYPYLQGFIYDEIGTDPELNPIPGLEEVLYAGGSGTSEDPYQIEDWGHLHNIRKDLGAYFILNNNIDETSSGYETYASATANGNQGWLPIGSGSSQFTGYLDGKNHFVKGLTINRPETDYVGLFSETEGGQVNNLGLIDVSIVGKDFVGGLIGSKIAGNFSKLYVKGSVSGVNQVGGLAGRQHSGGSLNNSYTDVEVFSSGIHLGGFVGLNNDGGTINTSYSVGKVTGSGSDIGGFTGFMDNGGRAQNCFWDTETSGLLSSAGGTGKTTAEMKMLETFSGWNFSTENGAWSIKETENNEGYISYPYLQSFSYDIPETEPEINPIPGLEEIVIVITPSGNNILHVKKGGAGTFEGDSWENAIPELAHALNWARENRENDLWSSAEPLQIWVAGGTYLPLYNAADGFFDSDGDRDNSFVMVRDVQLFGGFAGTEISLEERDLALKANTSILSGDLLGNDGKGFLNFLDNAHHVLISAGNVGVASLDGFTVSGGNSNGLNNKLVFGRNIARVRGAGMIIVFSSPEIRNVIFSENTASVDGGGIYNANSQSNFTNVLIANNRANDGAGVYNNFSSGTYTNVTIANNQAAQEGGGIKNVFSSNSTLRNVVVLGNEANTSPGIFLHSGPLEDSQITSSFSLIQGFTSQNDGNIDATSISPEAIFEDFENSDYSLKAGALPINAGDPDTELALFLGGPDVPVDLNGNARVIAGVIDMGAYERQQLPQTLTINTPPSLTYGDSDLTFDVTTTSGLQVTYSVVENDFVSVSSGGSSLNAIKATESLVEIMVSVAGNDTYDPASTTVSIPVGKLQLEIGDPILTPKEFDGTNIAFLDLGPLLNLIDGDDIEVSFTANYNNSAVGTGKTVTVQYEVSGNDAENYISLKEFISNDGVINLATITGIELNKESFVFDGSAKSLAIEGTLPEGTSVDYSNNSRTDVGNQTVTATISGLNYRELELTADLTITPATLTITALADQGKVYGTNDPELTFKATGFESEDDESILTGTLARAAGEDVGVYAINQGTLSASDNYSIEFTGADFNITTKTLTVMANPEQSKVYGANDPALTFKATGFVNEDDESIISGTLTRAAGEDVGVYAINQGTLSAGDNYSIEFTGADFNITTKTLTVMANPEQSKVYGANDPALTFKATGFVNEDDESIISGTLTRAAGEDVGVYAINQGTLSAGDNYSIEFTGADFNITTKTLTVMANPDQSKVYGANDPALTFKATGFVNEDDESIISGTLTRAAGEDIGVYAINQGTLSAGDNYSIEFTGADFNITTKTLTVMANPEQSKVYGANDPALTFKATGFESEDDESIFTGTLARAAGEDVGAYAINQGTLSAGDNYSIEFTGADFNI
ncbi:MBG domain-containing protein, partial [Mongoliibacter ruber]